MEQLGCIYLITCLKNNKKYVGQHCNPTPFKRFKEHLKAKNICPLHKAIRKYGKDAFKIETLCIVPYEALTRMEGYFAEQFETYVWNNLGGYNAVWCSNSPNLGIKHSNESRAKMSLAQKNMSAETRAKKSLAQKNVTDETRAKISLACKGRVISDETRAKLSLANKRRVISDETRAKMSLAKKNISDETRAKISLANKRRVISDETRANPVETLIY